MIAENFSMGAAKVILEATVNSLIEQSRSFGYLLELLQLIISYFELIGACETNSSTLLNKSCDYSIDNEEISLFVLPRRAAFPLNLTANDCNKKYVAVDIISHFS